MAGLILTCGLPASGKTTLARRLSRSLGIPMFSKDSMKELLTAAENRLQALFDAQEQEAFAPQRPATDRPGAAAERVSVKKNLAEKKAEAAMRNLPEKEKGKKSPGRDMEK